MLLRLFSILLSLWAVVYYLSHQRPLDRLSSTIRWGGAAVCAATVAVLIITGMVHRLIVVLGVACFAFWMFVLVPRFSYHLTQMYLKLAGPADPTGTNRQ